MKHPIKIEKYGGTLEELAEDISNLRYDKMYNLFVDIGQRVYIDAKKDESKGRKMLSNELFKISESILKMKNLIWNVWLICKKFVED